MAPVLDAVKPMVRFWAKLAAGKERDKHEDGEHESFHSKPPRKALRSRKVYRGGWPTPMTQVTCPCDSSRIKEEVSFAKGYRP